MDLTNLLSVVVTYVGEYATNFLETLRHPSLRFHPILGDNPMRNKVVSPTGTSIDMRATKFDPRLFSFAVLNIFIGGILHSLVTPVKDDPSLVTKVITVLLIWGLFGSVLHAGCRLIGGKGSIYDTISVYFQLSAVIYVVATLGALIWKISVPFIRKTGLRLQFAPFDISLMDEPFYVYFAIQFLLLLLYLPLSLKSIHGILRVSSVLFFMTFSAGFGAFSTFFYHETGIHPSLAPPPLAQPVFRSTSKSDLSEFEMKAMLFNRNLFDNRMNENGDGFPNNFDLENDNQVVVDNATQLIWQQSGSEYRMSHDQAQAYIDSLKNARFAGYSDWRLPTLEEAMSLMEASKRKDDLHIDKVFGRQWAIWTSDKTASSEAWMVSFDRGSCTYKSIDCYVRAVRVQ